MTQSNMPPTGDPNALLRYLASLKRTGGRRQIAQAADLLSHPDPDVRAEAISTVLTHGRLEEYRQVARSALLGDPAEEVRGAAAHALAAISSEETRTDDVQVLIGVLINLDESDEVRRDAYVALQIVQRSADFPGAGAEFLPEDDIDWSWVRDVGALHGIDVRREV